jgi:hypothetical protein
MRKKLILLVSAILLLGTVAILYLYKPHRNIADEAATFKVDSKTFFEEFTTTEQTANTKYLDQVIEVAGQVTAINYPNKSLTLDNHINVNLLESAKVNINDHVVFKGRCVGYDELMEEVTIDQATILKP